ncbi:MAG: amidohydrolase [Bacteroidaceae bacterium]
MKIAICQTDLVWKNRAANYKRMSELIERCKNVELYILPEMWSSGFAVDPSGAAEHVQDKDSVTSCDSFLWMKETAIRKNAAIAGSLAVEEDGKFYNRLYFVKPDGSYQYYNKHHLFTYGEEHLRYTPGEERVIVEYREMRILLQVCYDLRFPTFSRNHKDYDMAIYVASWPQPRQGAWDTLIRARAIENQCYIAAVNRIGEDPNCQYTGGSALIDPYGEAIAAFAPGQRGVAIATACMENLNEFREKFPVLDDAD